jgi:glycerate kinase
LLDLSQLPPALAATEVVVMVGFGSALSDARFVVTGERALGEQTLHGKAMAGVAARARAACVPLLAITGCKSASPTPGPFWSIWADGSPPKGWE